MRGGPAYTAPQAAPVASVHWGVSEIPVTSVDAQRDIGGAGLPGALGGDGSRVAGRARVGVVPDSNKGVVVYQGSPWRRQGGRPIPLGQPVTVRAGEAGADVHTVLTGTVVADDGGHTAAMSMTVEDDLGFLSRTTSWPALWRVMPPDQAAPAAYRGQYRRIGLSHWYVLDRALRASLRGCHPAWPGGVGISAPLVDSTWPEVGHLWASHSKANGASFQPGFRRTVAVPTRMADDVWATYAPNAPISLSTSGRIVTCLTVDPTHAAVTTVTIRWAGTVHLTVQVRPNREVRVFRTDTPGTYVSHQLGSGTRARVEVTQGGQVTITTDTGSAGSTGNISVASQWATGPVERVDVGADPGSAIGGLIITSHSAATYTTPTGRSLYYPSPDIPATLDWMPRRQSVEVGALVADIATATCSAWWVAADGNLRVKAPDVARTTVGQAFTTTLTSNVIGALAWSRQRDTARRQVVIKHDMPRTTMGLRPTVTLAEGSGQMLARGEQRVDIFNTPANEDWLAHTEAPQVNLVGAGEWAIPNSGQGTFWGGYVVKSATTNTRDRWATDELGAAFSFSATAGIYVFTSTAFAERLLADEQVVLATPPMDDSATALPTRYRDQSLPLLRGWVRTVAEETETRSTRTGPTNAPDLVHDAGPWVQAGAPALAEWIATKACPLPGEVGIITLDSIPIRPDYRIEVGDVLTLHDEDVTRLALTILVRRVHLTTKAGSSAMSLDVEVIDGHSTILTVGEVDGEFAGDTVGALDALKAGTTLAADALNPTVQPR